MNTDSHRWFRQTSVSICVDVWLINGSQARHRPIAKDRFAVDEISGDKAPIPAIIARVPVIPEYEVPPIGNHDLPVGVVIPELRLEVRFAHLFPVDEDGTIANLHLIPRNSEHPLDE